MANLRSKAHSMKNKKIITLTAFDVILDGGIATAFVPSKETSCVADFLGQSVPSCNYKVPKLRYILVIKRERIIYLFNVVVMAISAKTSERASSTSSGPIIANHLSHAVDAFSNNRTSSEVSIFDSWRCCSFSCDGTN